MTTVTNTVAHGNLEAVAAWNADKATATYRQAAHVKNVAKQEEMLRDFTRLSHNVRRG
jgi:hypothetical protein